MSRRAPCKAQHISWLFGRAAMGSFTPVNALVSLLVCGVVVEGRGVFDVCLGRDPRLGNACAQTLRHHPSEPHPVPQTCPHAAQQQIRGA